MRDQIPLVCLGSAAALTDGRDWNSLLIDGKILLELPPTTVPQLHRLGIDFSQIETIFISHLHADHMFGLPFFLLEYCVRRSRANPLVIVGPRKLEDITYQLCSLAWPELRENGFEPCLPLSFIEISEGDDHKAGDLSFAAVAMNHFGLDAFGYRFSHKGRTIGYTGDTGEGAQINQLLKDVDVAILELTHPRESDDLGHMNRPAVERLAPWLTAQGSAIFATHMSSIPDPIPGVTLCEDGKTYWI